MLDLMLVHAYFLAEDPKEQQIMKPFPPLGLLYISSHLKTKGFKVEIFDGTFRRREDFWRKLAEQRPFVVGLYVNLMTKRNALELIAAGRAAGSIVILGGPDPALYKEEYLAAGADIVVFGEGELTLEELLPHLKRRGLDDLDRIAGIAFRARDGSIVSTAPRPYLRHLDAQPFPDRSAIDFGVYLRAWKENHGRSCVSLITARGCVFTCRWCSHATYGLTHRRRSPANVADELEAIMRDYQPDSLWYADDVFTINRPWLARYAAQLKERGLGVPFETITRADCLDETSCDLLAQMGCRKIWIGTESGSQKILDAMDRRVTVEQIFKATRMLKERGILTGFFIMLGYEGETKDDLRATARLLATAQPDEYLTTVSYPIKGTPYYEQVQDNIRAPVSWNLRTDREHALVGRRSKQYYQHAARWLRGHYMLAGARTVRRGGAAVKNIFLGRWGMWRARHELEVPI